MSESPFFTELDGFPLDLTAEFCAAPVGCWAQGSLPISAVASDVAVNMAQCSPRGGVTAWAGKIPPLILTLRGSFPEESPDGFPRGRTALQPRPLGARVPAAARPVHAGFPGLPVLSVCIS